MSIVLNRLLNVRGRSKNASGSVATKSRMMVVVDNNYASSQRFKFKRDTVVVDLL